MSLKMLVELVSGVFEALLDSSWRRPIIFCLRISKKITAIIILRSWSVYAIQYFHFLIQLLSARIVYVPIDLVQF